VNTPPASTRTDAIRTAAAHSPAHLLPAFEWDLVAVRDGRGQNDARWRVAERPPLRLAFKDGRVVTHNLCNLANASYQLDGTQLRISQAVATLRACSEAGLMALEQRVLKQLPTVQTLEVRATDAAAPATPHITLRFADGAEWDLAGKPTPETRYGSAGERLFLEVAALKVGCNHPLMRNLTCLRVRDVAYSDNGVKTSSGEWRIFQGGIEGYEHREGVRNILRVNRYSLARNGQLPADALSHAYVLDMVVESEVSP
jgi:heat shock protein HslJ